MRKGFAGTRFIPHQQIGEKDIFPRPARNRSRFDLAEADFAKRKDTEGLEQCPGNVRGGKRDRSLVGSGQDPPPLGNQKESSEIPFVVFQRPQKDLSAILLLGLAAGDSGGILCHVFVHVFHGTSSVVKRHRLKVAMLLKKPAALCERDWMR